MRIKLKGDQILEMRQAKPKAAGLNRGRVALILHHPESINFCQPFISQTVPKGQKSAKREEIGQVIPIDQTL